MLVPPLPPGRMLTPLGEGQGRWAKRFVSSHFGSSLPSVSWSWLLAHVEQCQPWEPRATWVRFSEVGGPVLSASPTISSKPEENHQRTFKTWKLQKGASSYRKTHPIPVWGQVGSPSLALGKEGDNYMAAGAARSLAW